MYEYLPEFVFVFLSRTAVFRESMALVLQFIYGFRGEHVVEGETRKLAPTSQICVTWVCFAGFFWLRVLGTRYSMEGFWTTSLKPIRLYLVIE